MSGQPTPRQVLDYATVQGYLQHVPRPSGDDGWRWPLYVALVNAGFLPGVVTGQDGTFESFPEAAQMRADILIAAAVKALEAK